MNKPENIVISGAGASGLSLAWHLKQTSFKGLITLIDPQLTAKNDKTWCFWEKDALLFPELLHHQWENLSVIGSDGAIVEENLLDHAYHCIRSETYQKLLLDAIQSDSRFSLVKDEVLAIEPNKHGESVVCTKKETIAADLVFQSHFRPDEDELYKSRRIALKQHFLGWDVQMKSPVFNPNKAILMDFRICQTHGFAFVYVLPFSQTEALVELTFFTPDLLNRDEYGPILAKYLDNYWNADYEILREEFGVIPMVDGFFTSTLNAFPIGIAGGNAKASTGYTFSRIQAESRRIAEAIDNNIMPEKVAPSPARFRFYDLLILHIIKEHPDKAVGIFVQLFQKNGFDAMFRFLSEKTTPDEDIRIMASVPKYSDFFAAIWKTKHRFSAQF